LLGQVEEAITALQTTPAWQFLMGGAERIFAILLHLALSVFVWFAVKNKDKRYLFPFAILVHALVDGATVILSEKDLPIYVLEAVVAVLALAAFFSALRLYRKEEAENAAPEEPGTAQG
ncbi:MAG: YhfC family intramembrane metalloprotease, partial [Lachnospiraceae bacterium]|nr:YhfC family intramembrane metalloprotease [Lachnospiraceae bacterium]